MNLEFWIKLNDKKNKKFLNVIEYYHTKFDSNLKLAPRYYMWSCTDCT